MTQDNDVSRDTVLGKLTGRVRPKLVDLDNEKKEIGELIKGTVVDGEGNSCLVIGPRSTGKSCLVEGVLEKLRSEHPEQFLTVRLSGFSLSDDKMAIREISRQLDAVFSKTPGYSSLDMEALEKKSMSETLSGLLAVFDQNSPESVAVVFVLEEVDRFAVNSRQTLLYNLLEISQTSRTGVAIVGISARMSIREMLEKRVRSRFSQRIYHIKRPQTLDRFWAVCKANLIVPDHQQWNEHIDKLYSSGGELFKLVEHIFYTTKDVRQFNSSMIYPVATANPFIDPSKITGLQSVQGLADTQSFVTGLSELELALLISAARMEVKLEADTLNFNIAYDEYVEVAKSISRERSEATTGVSASGSGAGYRIWSKEVARSAWERLEGLDIILPLHSSTAKGIDASRDDIKMVKVDTGLMELGNMIGRNHRFYKWTRL